MTLADLTHKTAQTTGNSLKQTKRIIDEFLDHLADAIKAGEDIQIKGLFSVSTKMHAARPGRNPRTGASLVIPAHKTVHFTASRHFRNFLKGKRDV